MPLGTEVGLGPSHIVLDADPASPKKGAQQPSLFDPCLLWPKAGWIKMPLGTDVGLRPGHIVISSYRIYASCFPATMWGQALRNIYYRGITFLVRQK